MKARGWAAPLRAVRTLVYGPDGPGAAQATMLGLQLGMELDGRMGTPHFGIAGTPSRTYSGWIADPQSFRGAAQLGATTTPPAMPQPALPSTTPPSGYPTWLQDWTTMEGLVP